MDLKNVTWQEVTLITVLFAGTIVAHKFLGEAAGGALAAFTTGLAFLMGRNGQGDSGE